MTLLIISAVVLGVGFGYYIFPPEWYSHTDSIISFGLCALLLFVGMDMGKQKNLLDEIKGIGWNILLIPVMIAIGSIFGAVVAGYALDMPWHESGAVGAGFGWYSLSAVILADYSSELSAVAFLTNVIREVLAIMTLPLIAKFIGDYETIAPCGATAMDTTLPIITRYTNPKTAVTAFITGVTLSALVPFIVPIIINLG